MNELQVNNNMESKDSVDKLTESTLDDTITVDIIDSLITPKCLSNFKFLGQ